MTGLACRAQLGILNGSLNALGIRLFLAIFPEGHIKAVGLAYFKFKC